MFKETKPFTFLKSIAKIISLLDYPKNKFDFCICEFNCYFYNNVFLMLYVKYHFCNAFFALSECIIFFCLHQIFQLFRTLNKYKKKANLSTIVSFQTKQLKQPKTFSGVWLKTAMQW